MKPTSLDSFIYTALGVANAGSNFIGWAVFGALSWSIWLARNDAVFRKQIVKSPINILFKTISLLSQWKCITSGDGASSPGP
jgi:hypothetical protein